MLAATNDHDELRNQLKREGVKNSFAGASEEVLRELLKAAVSERGAPQQLLRSGKLKAVRSASYQALTSSVTLERLATWLPDEAWSHWLQSGWVKLDAGLSKQASVACNTKRPRPR